MKWKVFMRKVITLILDYFLILVIGFIIGMFIFLQYYDSISLVAGTKVTLSREIVLYGVFSTLPVLFILAPFGMMLYKIRHRSNPKSTFATYCLLCLVNWFLFYPLSLMFQNQMSKDMSSENINNQNDLSAEYFRKSCGKLYYFSHKSKDGIADVVLVEDPLDVNSFASEVEVNVDGNSDFAKDSYPFHDPLIKESMNDIPYLIINLFRSIKVQAIHAWNYGIIAWLCFCSFGFALGSFYSLLKFSSWRLVNAFLMLFFTSVVIWFNDFYFSVYNEEPRNFLRSLFYDSGKLNFFVDRGIEFPLMLINLLVALVFVVSGIMLTILRNQEED